MPKYVFNVDFSLVVQYFCKCLEFVLLFDSRYIYICLFQVIASGDFKQLPPVPNIRYGDIGNHCFQSRVFTDLFAHHINLDVVSLDSDFNCS